MRQVLFFVPLSNQHRLPIMEQIAREERFAGNSTVLYSEFLTPICDENNNISLNMQALLRHLNPKIYDRIFLEGPGIIELWNIVKGSKDAKIKYIEYRKKVFREFLASNRFDYIYIWNGNFPYQTDFIKIASNFNFKIKYVEVGWLDQNNTYYIDSKGVNAASQISVNAISINDSFNAEGRAFCKKYRAKNFSNLSISDDYILVPMQVESDSNIRLYSPFKSMKEFVAALDTWLPKDVKVKVRPHPKSIMKEFALPDRFYWSKESNIFKDIARAKCVIGINSTVLLQSLALGKPVMALGEGVWGGNTSIAPGNTKMDFKYPKYNEHEAENLVGYLVGHQKNYTQKIFRKRRGFKLFCSAVLLLKIYTEKILSQNIKNIKRKILNK